MKIFLICLVLTGCSYRNAGRVTLVTSTASIACDWSQTRSAAESGWSNRYEGNPILGDSPTPSRVDSYMSFALASNVILWAALPDKYRWIAPAAITLIQTRTIVGNNSTIGSCI